jgi:phospholipid transport system substrate-binding protein
MRGEKMLKKYIVCVLAIFFLNIGSYYALAQSTPKSHIETTIGDILKVLSDSSLKGSDRAKERRETVIKVIEKGFDFREMSRRALGKHWKKLKDEQKEEFIRLFSRLMKKLSI